MPAVAGKDHNLPLNVAGCPGFSLIWDNVQIQEISRHQSIERHNQFRLWANCLGAINRIFSRSDGNQVLKAMDIDLPTFVPGRPDEETIYRIAVTLITRILARNVPHFKSYKDVVTWHIEHEHSEASAQKSKVVRA